ncbi:helix-turn-helix transcriptional regulator, partial [Kineococcus sp. SYSU DK006]|uniref:helix-turn-helix transcriptional regulator n=1 Tax=Kineococcus sp. SYSU DK006 TaxID=3383127 RepID=UPI003D7C8DFD
VFGVKRGGALPTTYRAAAGAAAGAVAHAGAGWGQEPPPRPAVVELLQRAVVDRLRVQLDYRSRSGTSSRTVDPLGLVAKDGTWYLLAGTADGRRTFRADRVERARVLDERFERPAGFELATAWREVVDEVERRRAGTSAVVVVAHRFLPVLRAQFGRACEVVDEQVQERGGDAGGAAGGEAGGRSRVRVAAPTALDLARTLAGWGGQLEVEQPASVRTELARIGAELLALHGGAEPGGAGTRGAGTRGAGTRGPETRGPDGGGRAGLLP